MSSFSRWVNIGMLLVLLITGWFVWQIRYTRFDYDFEHFFPVESDDAEFYYRFRDKFGADNDFLLIGIQSPATVFHPDFLKGVDSLSRDLGRLPFVKSVQGLTNMKIPVINSFGFAGIPLLNFSSESAIKADSIRLVNSGAYTGNLISADMRSTLLLLRHDRHLPKEKADTLLLQLEQTIHNAGLKNVFYTGKIRWEKTYLDKTRAEMFLFIAVSLVLVTLLLWATFRSFWGVMVPLLVVSVSIVWTLGLMAASGKAIDLMVILIPCILFVVGMSDVIHITSQFHEKIMDGLSRQDAIKAAIREVGFATLLTCLATAIAFITLRTTAIKPIQDFGTYTAFGVLAAYILSITILPWMLLRVKNPDRLKIHTLNLGWDRKLKHILRWVFRNPKRILLISSAVVLVSAWGISRIQLNNALLDDLSDDDPLKVDFAFFDKHFTGVRAFEMEVSSRTGNSILSWENMQTFQKVNRFLKDSLQMGSLITPVEIISGFNQAVHDGDVDWYGVPASKQSYDSLLSLLKPHLKSKPFRNYIQANNGAVRFSGMLKDKGSKAVGIKNARLNAFLENLSETTLQFRITGSSDLIDKSNNYLTANMLEGLSLDLIVLMGIIFILFRSWRMMLISVLPNLIPLIAVAGLMGIAGIEMKVTISIVFSIAFGIAIDDTLHLLSRLRVELDKGSTLPHALRTTYLSTGKAMILTALIISSGFAILMLSSFKSTFYVGLMISLTLIIALIAELFLMPVLILYMYGKHYKKTNRYFLDKSG